MDRRKKTAVAVIEHEKGKSAPLIHERPQPSQWIWYVLGSMAVLALVEFIIFNDRWQWDVVGSYIFSSRILTGVFNTLQLTVVSSIIGLMLGIVLAVCRLSSNVALRTFAIAWIWLARAIPTLVALLFIYFAAALLPTIDFGLPFFDASLFSIDTGSVLTRWSAAVIGLAFFLAGMSAEIFRGGLKAIDKGQWEACASIGMSRFTAMRVVVAPQTIRVITPALANEIITQFKNTSLVTVIGYLDLLTTVQMIYSTNFQTIPLLTVAVIWYLFLTSIALIGQRALEKKFGKGFDGR